jgi:hypothetical protein
MGLLNNILGKKEKSEELVLEPSNGGYSVKGYRANAPSIGRVCVFFSASAPAKEEQAIVKSLMGEYGFGKKLAEGAQIITAYETIPGIDGYLSSGEIPEELNAFLMSRAMLKSLAHSQAEMGKLIVNPFLLSGMKGVLVQKEL